MAPRRRKKVGLSRMDAAVQAMSQMGFESQTIRRKVKELLKEYGGDEGWIFIEDCSYRVLLDSLLDEQDMKSGPPLLMDAPSQTEIGEPSSVNQIQEIPNAEIACESGLNEDEGNRISLSIEPMSTSHRAQEKNIAIASVSVAKEKEAVMSSLNEDEDGDAFPHLIKKRRSTSHDQELGIQGGGVSIDDSSLSNEIPVVLPPPPPPVVLPPPPPVGSLPPPPPPPVVLPPPPPPVVLPPPPPPVVLPPPPPVGSLPPPPPPPVVLPPPPPVGSLPPPPPPPVVLPPPPPMVSLPPPPPTWQTPPADHQPKKCSSRPKRRPCYGWLGSDENDFVLLPPMEVHYKTPRQRPRGESKWDAAPDFWQQVCNSTMKK